jgi:hypothetical protein
MNLRDRILQRIQGRIELNLNTLGAHQDPDAQHDASVRLQAYVLVKEDIERIWNEEMAEWAARAADALFPTREDKEGLAAKLGMPVEYLFPKIAVETTPGLFVLRCGCYITTRGVLVDKCGRHEHFGPSGTILTKEQLDELNPLAPDP